MVLKNCTVINGETHEYLAEYRIRCRTNPTNGFGRGKVTARPHGNALRMSERIPILPTASY
jgi:hypothetical protein